MHPKNFKKWNTTVLFNFALIRSLSLCYAVLRGLYSISCAHDFLSTIEANHGTFPDTFAKRKKKETVENYVFGFIFY